MRCLGKNLSLCQPEVGRYKWTLARGCPHGFTHADPRKKGGNSRRKREERPTHESSAASLTGAYPTVHQSYKSMAAAHPSPHTLYMIGAQWDMLRLETQQMIHGLAGLEDRVGVEQEDLSTTHAPPHKSPAQSPPSSSYYSPPSSVGPHE
jgi:hypothetical protein